MKRIMNGLLPFFFFLIPVVAAIAPRGMAAGIDTIGVACALQLFIQRKQVYWRDAWRTLRWVIAALAFIALSACWSVSPRALEMLRDTMLVSVAALLIFTASHLWSQQVVDRALRWFLLSALLTFALFTLHAALGYPLNLCYSHISVETLLGTNIPKRTAALFALLLWPAALCLYRFHKHAYANLLLIVATVMIMTLPSRAALLGAVLGLATYGLATITPRAGRAIGLFALPLAMPLMLALALCLPQLPQDWSERLSATLPMSGEFRLEIWNFAAQKAVERMPLGIGIDGSRTLATPADIVRDGSVANSLLPDHPHNVYLQLWLEGGVIGAVLTIALTALLWLRLRRLPARLQPFVWGYTVTAAVTLGIAYGTWQAWWLAGHLLAAILLALLCRAEEARPQEKSHEMVPETTERPRTA